MLRRSNWKNVDKQEKFLLPKLHVVLMALLSNAMVAKTQKSNGKFSLQPDIKIYALQEVCNNFLYNSTMRLKQLKAYMNFNHGM